MDIYGEHREILQQVMEDLMKCIGSCAMAERDGQEEKLYEHLNCRLKSDSSMREKLDRLGLEQNTYHALHSVTDAIGVRVVCLFIEDVYEIVHRIRQLPGCSIVQEKDYIRDAKPNGYRSYHMILQLERDLPDDKGNLPGIFYAEVQLRTIAMDTWAALEHELKYKKQIENTELISQELRRCANELAACDVSMQTLKQLIRAL